VGGHEGVGKVVKLGPGAENSSIKVGDRVGIKWVSGTCGSCRRFSCLSFSSDALCENPGSSVRECVDSPCDVDI